MMARRVSLLSLLAALGIWHVVAQTAAPGVIQTQCEVNMNPCIVAYDGKATGASTTVNCAAFVDFEKCYRENIDRCNRFNGEADVYENKFNQILNLLPPGCTLSTTPYDLLQSAPSSGSSGRSSSGIVLPPSGTSGGRTSGSSFIYMNWWQWCLFGSCICCCCLLIALAGCRPRRNRGMYGPDPYYDPYLYPEVVPLSQPMSYAGVMPTTTWNQQYPTAMISPIYY